MSIFKFAKQGQNGYSRSEKSLVISFGISDNEIWKCKPFSAHVIVFIQVIGYACFWSICGREMESPVFVTWVFGLKNSKDACKWIRQLWWIILWSFTVKEKTHLTPEEDTKCGNCNRLSRFSNLYFIEKQARAQASNDSCIDSLWKFWIPTGKFE